MGRDAARFSPSEALQTPESAGFKADRVEKALHLPNLPNALDSHPFLKSTWVLKDGTALNMLKLELPGLSVDIDLNNIAAQET